MQGIRKTGPRGAFGKAAAWLVLSWLGAGEAGSALSWPGCEDLKESEFRKVDFVTRTSDPTLAEPLKMTFDMDASGNTDVYFAERPGSVKRFSFATGTVTLVGKVATTTASEDGLTGIVLDPGFKANRRLYLFYSSGPEFRLSRFTLAGNLTLDMASEVVVLRVPSQRGKVHTGGSMFFDAYGDLWLSVGDNGAGEAGPANSNDLRGAVLRIHPRDDGSYSIPKGNWKETLTGYSAADLQKVRPEIYVKGVRNAYTIGVDPVRRWLVWGDVGPDVPQTGLTTEEHNLVTKPGFMGWPYFAGANRVLTGGKVPSAPVNDAAGNTGLVNLPPAVPATRPYFRSTAMTGPIYRYDGDSPSRIKLPPHLHRKWLMADYRAALIPGQAGRWFAAGTVDEAGNGLVGALEPFLPPGMAFNRIVDAQVGPDGALYVVNYAGWYSTSPQTHLSRVEYTGACRPTEPKLERPAPTRAGPLPAIQGARLDGADLVLSGAGGHRVTLVDAKGKVLAARQGRGSARYTFPEASRAGLCFLRVVTSEGAWTRSLARLDP